jgi:hypothetical protein
MIVGSIVRRSPKTSLTPLAAVLCAVSVQIAGCTGVFSALSRRQVNDVVGHGLSD